MQNILFSMVDLKTGKKKKSTLYGKTHTEKLEKLITELNTNIYVDKNNMLFKDLDKELIDNEFKLNKLSEGSYARKLETYMQICRHYIADMYKKNDAKLLDLINLTK